MWPRPDGAPDLEGDRDECEQLAVPTRAEPECRSAGCHGRPRPSPSAVRGRHDLPEVLSAGPCSESHAH